MLGRSLIVTVLFLLADLPVNYKIEYGAQKDYGAKKDNFVYSPYNYCAQYFTRQFKLKPKHKVTGKGESHIAAVSACAQEMQKNSCS